MTSIPCNIVILPSNDLTERAIQLSADFQKFSSLFQLRSTGPFPHASLYMTQLKVADLDKVKALLADIATSIPQLNLAATHYVQAEGYLDVEYARTDVLDTLQMTVIEAINPIRDGMREKDKACLLTATGKVRENLEKYGYRGVGELFRPHLTLTRFVDGQSLDTTRLPTLNGFSGQFTKLGLFEMGDNGTCARKIAAFKLGGKT